MNRQPYLTTKAQKQMEEKFKLEHEAIEIFNLVVAEWSTDPTSVQCFDLRIVERAKYIAAQLQKLPVFMGS